MFTMRRICATIKCSRRRNPVCEYNTKFAGSGQLSIHANLSSKVPQQPTWAPVDTRRTKMPELSDELLRYLERTSLVQFENKDGVEQLHEAIKIASQLSDVNTEGVEPLHSLQENEVAYLREDIVEDGDNREQVLSQASKTVEDWYFVAPPGNIPLNQASPDQDKS